MASEPKIDFKVLDAAIKKVLAYKPKKKQSPNAHAHALTEGSGHGHGVPSEPGRES